MCIVVFREPCPKCKGTLTEEHLRDEVYEWFYCINCGTRLNYERTQRHRPADLPDCATHG